MKKLVLLLAFLAVGACATRTRVFFRPVIRADTTSQVADTTGPDSTGFLTIRQAPLGAGNVLRYGWLDPVFRDSVLAKMWKPEIQNERAWCVTRWTVLVDDRVDVLEPMHVTIDSSFIVYKMEPAKNPTAASRSVTFDCPMGMPQAHLHPPQSCLDDTLESCKLGGFIAYQCQPSETDVLSIINMAAPFGVVVCGPNQVRFFFPFELLSNRWKGSRKEHGKGN